MAKHAAQGVLVSLLLTLFVACAPPPFGAVPTALPSPLPTPTLQATPPLMVEPTLAYTLAAEGTQIVSLKGILQAPDRFRDQFVRLEGHGVTMATFPLCPGYVGLDERQRFVDAEGQMIVATIAFTWPEGVSMYDAETVRLFEGYIRIFQGPIGCPGSTQERMVPYFEIRGVELKK